MGRLLYVTGLAYFIGNLAASPDPLLHHAGMALPALWLVGVGVLVLAYPSDRLERRQDRLLAAGAFAFMVVTGAAFVTQLDPTRCLPAFCPANPFRLDVGVNLAPTIATVSTAGWRASCSPWSRSRWRAGGWSATPSARRSLAPLWFAAGVPWPGMAGGSAWRSPSGDNPVSLALRAAADRGPGRARRSGVLRARIDQAAVGDLVVRLGSHPADEELECRRASRGRPDARPRRAGSPTGSSSICAGSPSRRPLADHRVTRVEAGDELLAVLIHDVGLDANPELMRSVAAATRLALENRRLAATVQTQLDDVRASRARIVEASDAERERIERDLHDGAQQRLVTLALRLRMIAGDAVDPGRPAAIEAAADELDEALAELRDLARGIHPTAVVQGGLASAVEALAERTPLPVSVRVPAQRWPIGIEVAAYFVVAEALTNAVRHARATQAEVTVIEEDGRLRVSIADDGVGGADPGRGTGLGGLADRLAALGGGLEVVSPPGGGTIVRGDLPLATP